MKRKIKVFEAFAGIGTQAMALKRLQAKHPGEIEFDFVGISEIKKNAITAYVAVHGDVANYGDISLIDWNNVPDFGLFTYSFPCQDISMAGKQAGFEAGSGTRSSLLWECGKAIAAKRPKYLLMENVKALMQHKFADHFKAWRDILSDLGYSNFYKVLKAQDFGVPQSRERIFMVSVLGPDDAVGFDFPCPRPLTLRLKDVLENDVEEKFYLKDEQTRRVLEHCANQNEEGDFDARPKVKVVGSVHPERRMGKQPSLQYRIYSPNAIAPCLTACDVSSHPYVLIEGKTRQTPINTTSDGMAFTITSRYGSMSDCNITKGGAHYPMTAVMESTLDAGPEANMMHRIRRLTNRECFRLMGVCDADIDKMMRTVKVTNNKGVTKEKPIISRSGLYELAGNAIVVDVLEAVFERMFIG